MSITARESTWGTYVVLFSLIPVHRVLGTDGAVAGVGGVAASSVCTALTGQTRLADGLSTNVTGDIALEAIHVHCKTIIRKLRET